MLKIIFEGLDGSGKTTLINLLQNHYQSQLQPTTILSGLGSSSIGKTIRDMLFYNPKLTSQSFYLLSFANLIQNQLEIIQPLQHTNQLIFIDRWIASNYAYQSFIKPIDPEFKIFKIFHEQLTSSNDIIIYLDIDPEVGLQRKKQQNQILDSQEQKPITHFQQVHKGYYSYLTHYCQNPFLVLSTTNNLETNLQQTIDFIDAQIESRTKK